MVITKSDWKWYFHQRRTERTYRWNTCHSLWNGCMCNWRLVCSISWISWQKHNQRCLWCKFISKWEFAKYWFNIWILLQGDSGGPLICPSSGVSFACTNHWKYNFSSIPLPLHQFWNVDSLAAEPYSLAIRILEIVVCASKTFFEKSPMVKWFSMVWLHLDWDVEAMEFLGNQSLVSTQVLLITDIGSMNKLKDWQALRHLQPLKEFLNHVVRPKYVLSARTN